MAPVLIAIAVLVLIVAVSLVSLRRIRWRRKPHLGDWKEWPD